MRNPKWHRDEIILALALYFDKDRGSIDSGNPKIILLSKILNQLPIFKNKPNEKTFRNANGVTLKLSNFMTLDPYYKGKGMISYSKLDKEVFEEFANKKAELFSISEKIKQIVGNNDDYLALSKIEDDEITIFDGAREGQILYKLHKVRERNQKLIVAKKDKAIKLTGYLKCEACEFDFYEFYGKLGEGFSECHHLKPLSLLTSSQKTQLDDLALLCSNCHKMIHRHLEVKSIQEFKNLWNK